MTDERALKLARKIAADIWELDASNRQAVLNGEYDSIRQVQSALAAIKLTTKLAAEYAHAHVHFGVKAGLLRFDHLPADGGENV